jgi:hypothetical protein
MTSVLFESACSDQSFMRMKLPALLLLVFASTPVNSQTILTTYYVVPPTSGCDGLGAFGPASTIWQPPCSAPYTYVAEPDGCAQGAASGGAVIWFDQDTVYANLCSIPCTIIIYDVSGECVTLCEIPGITEVMNPQAGGPEMLHLTPDPVPVGTPLRITSTSAAFVDVNIVDLQGREVLRARMSSQPLEIGTDDFRPGVHLVQARWNDGRTMVHRFIVE